MNIEWFRDLVFTITGVMVIIVLIYFIFISYAIFRRVRRILDSAQAISLAVQKLAGYLDEVAKPLIQIAAIVQGIRQGIDVVSEMMHRRGKNE